MANMRRKIISEQIEEQENVNTVPQIWECNFHGSFILLPGEDDDEEGGARRRGNPLLRLDADIEEGGGKGGGALSGKQRMLVKQGKGAMGAKHKAMMASAAVKRLRNRRWLMIWIIQGIQNVFFQFQKAVTLKHCISEVWTLYPKMNKPECTSEVVFKDLANTFWHT